MSGARGQSRGVLVWLVLISAVLIGCHGDPQAQNGPAGAPNPGGVQLLKQRAEHEAEIRSLQRQYGDVLGQREAELATCQRRLAELEQDLETAVAENLGLREKIRVVRTEIARLQQMLNDREQP